MKPSSTLTATNADSFCFAESHFVSGNDTGSAILCNGWVPVGIVTPADLAGAAAASMLADAGDGNYLPTFDRAGAADAIVLTAGAFIKLAPSDYPGFASVKLKLDAAPSADITLQIMLRSIND